MFIDSAGPGEMFFSSSFLLSEGNMFYAEIIFCLIGENIFSLLRWSIIEGRGHIFF